MSALSDGRGKRQRRSQRIVSSLSRDRIAQAAAFGVQPLESRLFFAATPFNGAPFQLPQVGAGTLTIQAEDFDNGGEAVGYHDRSSGNAGGAYRNTDVDLEATADTGGGYDVFAIQAGEWEQYTVNAPTTGIYTFDLRLASASAGGTFHLESDGQSISGSLTLPATGGAQNWKTVTATGINLAAGQHALRVVFDANASTTTSVMGEFNWMRVTQTSAATVTPTISVAATDPNAAEANADPGVFTITRSGSTTGSLTVNYALSGTAVNGTDYQALSGQAVIPNGQGSVNVTVTPVDIHQIGGTKTAVLQLQGGTGYTVGGTASDTVTIAENDTNTTPPPADGTPYSGTPLPIASTGTTTLELENFNNGADGIAYHDADSGNVFGSAYRSGTGVDVYDTAAASNGHLVGWTKAGEWLKYSVNVGTAGTYALAVNTAAVGLGGAFHVEVDGQNVSGTLAAPDTGDWSKFQAVNGGNISLTAGQHVIRFVMDSSQQANGYMANFDNLTLTGGAATPLPGAPSNPTPANGATLAASPTTLTWTAASNAQSYAVYLDGQPVATVNTNQWTVSSTLAAGAHSWMIVAQNATGNTPGPTWNFTVSPPPPSNDGTPFTGTPLNISGGGNTIEIENFNNGGEGAAWHDTDASNVFGGSYRAGSSVDVYDTAAASNGHLVGWTKAGEWLKYTVNVATAGNYKLAVKAASVGAGGQFHFEVDGQNASGTLAAPDTGDWSTFQTIDGGSLSLSAGSHVIRLVFDTAQQPNGYMANFDSYTLTTVGSPVLPPPGQASVPNPVDGAALASSPSVLRWTSASNAQSYDVFLDGALAANVVASQWNVDRTLAAGSHTWQIVARNTTGTNPSATWSFTVSPPPPSNDGTPYNGSPVTIAASGSTTIEIENFNNGAEGVAYHDLDASNVFGSSYRSGTGVDVYDTTSAANGHLVGWTKAGEWLKYSVSVGTAGNYAFNVRAASVGLGGTFHFEVDGQDVTGSLSAPDTGDWLKFQTITSGNVALAAGQRTLRLVMDSSQQSNGYMANFDNFSVTPATATGAGSQPDLQIRNYGDTSYQGDNVYNTNGLNQVVGGTVPFFPQIYQVRVQNDGSVADSFNITGPGAIPPNWHVWYFPDQVQQYAGAPEITAQVTGGGWNTGTIQPGQFRDFRFEVGPTANDAANDTYLLALTATSATNPGKADVVKANTVNGVRREVEIRRRNVAAPGPYAMDVQNEGNITDQYTVSGTGNGAGYTVSYFDDAAMTHDVTAAVAGGTYTTAPLAHLGLQTLVVRISPTDGQTHSVTVTATSKGDGSIKATSTISTATPPAAPAFFSIGVYSQPEFEFDTWKQRGINTLVGYESFGGQNSIDEWSQVAVDKGLYMIREPRANPSADINQANLLAWMQPDEPELRSDYTPAVAQQNYNAWKAADPTRPVLENFAGGYIMGWQGNITPATYQAYAQAADWISSGIYPVDGWARPEDLDVSGRTVDRLQSWTNGKPQFAIIESGPQNGSWLPKGFPGPTPTQLRAEVWDAVIHGAQGILYFPQSLNPTFSYDNTPADVAAEMTTQNARLTSIGAALVSPIDPPTLGFTAASPLEATWRSYGGKNYFIVLNMSDKTLSNQSMTLRGTGSAATAVVQGENRSVAISGGVVSDNFAPYEAHIYIV